MPPYKSQGAYEDSIILAVLIYERIKQKGGLVFNTRTCNHGDPQGMTTEGCADEIRVLNYDGTKAGYDAMIERIARYIDMLPAYEGRDTYVFATFTDDNRIMITEIQEDLNENLIFT